MITQCYLPPGRGECTSPERQPGRSVLNLPTLEGWKAELTGVVGYTGWAKKTGLFLRDDNFATIGCRNACDTSKFSKFYLEKNL